MMVTPFFLSLVYALPAEIEEEVRPHIRSLLSRLRTGNPSLDPEWIKSVSGRIDLARKLQTLFQQTFADLGVQNSVLIIIAEAQFITLEVEQKIKKFLERSSQSYGMRIRVILYTNASVEHLPIEIQNPAVTFLTYTQPDLVSGIFGHLEPEAMTAIQEVINHDSTLKHPLHANSTPPPTMSPSTDYAHLSSETAQVASTKAPTIPSYLRDYVSPVTFRYQPLPAKAQDPNPDWWFPENDKKTHLGTISGDYQWVMSAASRRGFSHWHSNRQRDDAFALGKTATWNIVAVADGAGSAKLSRVTANRSCEIAVATVKKNAPSDLPSDEAASKQAIQRAMQAAVAEIYDFQEKFNRTNGLDKRDTYSTFLLLVHQPFENGNCLFGVFHVGDGYMMASSPSLKRSSAISQADHGTVSNEAYFLLNFPKQELLNRVAVHTSPAPIEMFLMVTDGIEDDMKPSPKEDEQKITVHQKFERFAISLKNEHLIWPIVEDWADILDWLISYERKGSYDDRTIAVLTTTSR